MEYLKMIWKHFSRYLSSKAIAGIVGLGMTKYYTSVFTQAEYGIFSYYFSLDNYLWNIVSLSLVAGFSRIYFDFENDPESKKRYFSSIFNFLAIPTALFAIVALAFGERASNLIAPGTYGIYILNVLCICINCYYVLFERYFYLTSASKAILKATIASSLAPHIISVILMEGFGLGLQGRFTAILAAKISVGLIMLWKIRSQGLLDRTLDWSMIKATLAISLPALSTVMITGMMQWIDRAYINSYHSLAMVGTYSLACRISKGLNLIFEALGLAVTPYFFKNMKVDDTLAIERITEFSTWYFTGAAIVSAAAILADRHIVLLFSNDTYSQAVPVFSLAAAAAMVGAVYRIPGLFLAYHKKVNLIPLISAVSLAANFLLNWLLVPKMGSVGASLATMASIGIYSSTMFFYARKFMPISIALTALGTSAMVVGLALWRVF